MAFSMRKSWHTVREAVNMIEVSGGRITRETSVWGGERGVVPQDSTDCQVPAGFWEQ